MLKFHRFLMLAASWPLITAIAGAQCATSTCMPDGPQPGGAIYRICMPEQSCYNGKLVVFAHGYVDFTQPVAIPEDQLTIDGIYLPELVNKLGYGFAVSSYRMNGLAVLPGVQDLVELVGIFKSKVTPVNKTYVVGPSEGGIVSALSLEQYSAVYNAGLPACGAIGDFQKEINYIGDFRVLFDYFFPGMIPGSPADIPAEVINNWDSVYVPKIQQAVKDNPLAVAQLLKTSEAPIGLDPASVEETVVGVLWYNIFATNDARQKLSGQPFDNSKRIYTGSLNDVKLNREVQRFTADPAAVLEIAKNYQTTGKLTVPAVTIHTTGDQILPYWHEPLYRMKVIQQNSADRHVNIPILRYGHCNFKAGELLLSFALMVLKESGQKMPASAANLLPVNQRQEFLNLARQYGVLAP
jgi:hypothetical protein